jgi:hypothetical protein
MYFCTSKASKLSTLSRTRSSSARTPSSCSLHASSSALHASRSFSAWREPAHILRQHTLRIRYAYATHTLRIRYAYATHTLRIRQVLLCLARTCAYISSAYVSIRYAYVRSFSAWRESAHVLQFTCNTCKQLYLHVPTSFLHAASSFSFYVLQLTCELRLARLCLCLTRL